MTDDTSGQLGDMLGAGADQVEVGGDVLDLVGLLGARRIGQGHPSSSAAATASMSSKNVSGSVAIAAATVFGRCVAARPRTPSGP